MLKKYKRLNAREKTFVWLTLVVALFMPILYAFNVISALSMDPSSYECTSDSMMKQICHDPFDSSITWTMIYAIFFGWPLLIAWVSTGIFVLTSRLVGKSRRS